MERERYIYIYLFHKYKNVIGGNCIFSHSLAKLANMAQDKKVDKHTPPKPWGAKACHATNCGDSVVDRLHYVMSDTI